jgi:hypothetical protein
MARAIHALQILCPFLWRTRDKIDGVGLHGLEVHLVLPSSFIFSYLPIYCDKECVDDNFFKRAQMIVRIMKQKLS